MLQLNSGQCLAPYIELYTSRNASDYIGNNYRLSQDTKITRQKRCSEAMLQGAEAEPQQPVPQKMR